VCVSPKPGGNAERPGEREASWSAPALRRFGTGQPSQRSGVSAERRKLCGNSVGGFLPKAATLNPNSAGATGSIISFFRLLQIGNPQSAIRNRRAGSSVCNGSGTMLPQTTI